MVQKLPSTLLAPYLEHITTWEAQVECCDQVDNIEGNNIRGDIEDMLKRVRKIVLEWIIHSPHVPASVQYKQSLDGCTCIACVLYVT